MRRGLEAEGFAVDVAVDGNEALWRTSESSYDVIVLDIMLPGLNGFRVCRDAAREPAIWTPILMLTAKDGEFDEAEALDTGADDYLTKPFSFVVLVARLRALLRRAGGRRRDRRARGRRPPARPGHAHRCWRGDAEIDAHRRASSRVLEFLVRRVGEVVAKAEILDGVWDFDFDGDPNIVEVYVGHLRSKIDEPFGRRSIETVRGAGLPPRRDDG